MESILSKGNIKDSVIIERVYLHMPNLGLLVCFQFAKTSVLARVRSRQSAGCPQFATTPWDTSLSKMAFKVLVWVRDRPNTFEAE